MSDIVRSGRMGHYAVAFVVLFGSLAACLGQEHTPQSAAGDPPAQPDAAKPGATKENPPAPAVPTAQETPAAPVAPGPVQTTGTSPAPSAPEGKGKAPSKKGKNASAGTIGQATSTGVQEKPYEIGPEDVLFLNVLHQADVSQTLEVRPDGYVSVRFAGEVKAAGLTAPQLADHIAEKLKTYFNNPEVIIQVLKINSKRYYISGEVHKPGAYPLTAPKTIYQALIEAGGLADFGKGSKIYVLRGETKIPFNYKDVSRGRNLKQNILLQNGDVIQVP